MIIPALLWLAAGSALLAIAADWEERRRRPFYVLKPLTTLLILAAAAAATPRAGALGAGYQHEVVAALALSLAGDVCLMFEGDRWFAAGLGSFLLAHVLFIAAFLNGIPLLAPPFWSVLVVLYGLGLGGWLLPRAGALRLPVAAYCLVLLAMALAAALRYQLRGDTLSGRALAGALLFVASDSLLAVRKFGGPYPGAQALILGTYWAAIGLIAASV